MNFGEVGKKRENISTRSEEVKDRDPQFESRFHCGSAEEIYYKGFDGEGV